MRVAKVQFALLALLAAMPAIADDKPLDAARHLLMTGKYAEAEEAYGKLAESDPVSAALGLAKCHSDTGRLNVSTEILTAALAKAPGDESLQVALAQLAFDRGDYEAAEKSLPRHETLLSARWLNVQLSRVAGKLDEANKGARWFVDFYNKTPPSDPESLRYIGLATAQFARWNRMSDQFTILVNDLYPDALAQDADYWPAHFEMGLLFLEKYNEADATKEFKAALAINPHAAPVHAALAALAVGNFELTQAKESVDEAFAINPRLPEAHLVLADIHLANFEPQRAVEVLRGAIEINPVNEATLGRMAAALAALDGLKGGVIGPRAQKIVDEVTARNSHPGEFFFAMAETFDHLRRFPTAAEYYRKAGEVMPQLVAAAGQEGMMLMRLGDETRSRKLLDTAFEADPFNVRVSNTLKVLEVLDSYETLETDHFLIRFDPKTDKVLARYAAAWLEEQYPLLCKQFQFTPPQKSLFEIFNKAKNTDGHGWFSARMVGLPHIHTIGACAGQMVAMQSPSDSEQKFNWARVLKHEFIHVLNLQQTNFNIPHWYTEALATLNEGYPRSKEWNDLLVTRLSQGKLFNLDNINLGFIRARNGSEWNLAYCQAELYAEFMLAKFGPDSLAKLLAAYADNLSTHDAITRSFGIDQAEFETRYLEYVQEMVAALPTANAEEELSLSALEKVPQKADPENADLLAKLSQAKLARKDYPAARRLADAALKIDSKNQLAAYVRARLHLLIGETAPALDLLTGALNPEKPQANLLGLLAGMRLKAEEYDEAARLYTLGATLDPNDEKWKKSLASVYLKTNQTEKLAAVLAELAALDADDAAMRKKLAALAIESKDFAAAERWAREALQVDVLDAEVHRLLAEALEALGKTAEAKAERTTITELEQEN